MCTASVTRAMHPKVSSEVEVACTRDCGGARRSAASGQSWGRGFESLRAHQKSLNINAIHDNWKCNSREYNFQYLLDCNAKIRRISRGAVEARPVAEANE
jgi:hypothetical protein